MSALEFTMLRARPFEVCPSCGGYNTPEFSSRYAQYAELRRAGLSGEQALNEARVFAHCCRMHIAFAPVELRATPNQQKEDLAEAEKLQHVYTKLMSISRPSGGLNQVPTDILDPAALPTSARDALAAITPAPGEISAGQLIEASHAQRGQKEIKGSSARPTEPRTKKRRGIRRIKR